jgi:hypothetical protein
LATYGSYLTLINKCKYPLIVTKLLLKHPTHHAFSILGLDTNQGLRILNLMVATVHLYNVWGCDTAEDEDTLNVKLTIHHVAGEEI